YSSSLRDEVLSLLARFDVVRTRLSEGTLSVRSPLTGEVIASVDEAHGNGVPAAVARSAAAFAKWRMVPAPRRGELVRLLGEELRAAKADLGRLVTMETGKILSEGLGEVQEMIDI